MTIHDAVKTLLELFPNMDYGEDNNGQIVIYTGMQLVDDTLLPLFPDDIGEAGEE